MATTANILTLLKFYANKQNNASVNYAEFCDYLHRYAEHHVEEQPELLAYLGNAVEPIDNELNRLSDSGSITIQQNANKKILFVTPFYIDKFTARYAELEHEPSLPFPSAHELPKNCPQEVLVKKPVMELLRSLLENPKGNDKVLYGFSMPMDLPTLVFPSSVSPFKLVAIAAEKISLLLQRGEYHDYFLKKLKIQNPGKEISVKAFFTSFVQRPDDILKSLEDSADAYYYFTQLCFQLKKDYEKVKDFTQEDINVLQSVTLLEILSSFHKAQTQERQIKENAFRSLEAALGKPPLYFTYEDIVKFKDAKGSSLLNQYTEEDLKKHLHELSTDAKQNELPRLLVFKADTNTRYFVQKNRVIQLVIRLCNDARSTVKDAITKEWAAALRNYEKLPEMTNQQAFEARLETETAACSPILGALLHAPFLPLAYNEERNNPELAAEHITLFIDGQLVSYSALLMLNRTTLLGESRVVLPFWYTTPVISFFAALLFKKNKPEKKKGGIAEELQRGEKRIEEAEKELAKKDLVMSKKLGLRNGAKSLEEQMVPAGSTLEREMDAYCHLWNKKLGASRENLTEDVNMVVRENLRKVLRTISGDGFTRERIANIAQTLVATPTLQKTTRDPASLEMYIQLYLIKLVKGWCYEMYAGTRKRPKFM